VGGLFGDTALGAVLTLSPLGFGTTLNLSAFALAIVLGALGLFTLGVNRVELAMLVRFLRDGLVTAWAATRLLATGLMRYMSAAVAHLQAQRARRGAERPPRASVAQGATAPRVRLPGVAAARALGARLARPAPEPEWVEPAPPRDRPPPDPERVSARIRTAIEARAARRGAGGKRADAGKRARRLRREGRDRQVRPGPVVTMYELEPAPGLKASRVIGLADDIARSMSALSARVSTVPGRSVIGIELPNDKREKVVLREILSARDFGDGNQRCRWRWARISAATRSSRTSPRCPTC
jgi:hypothetical protein